LYSGCSTGPATPGLLEVDLRLEHSGKKLCYWLFPGVLLWATAVGADDRSSEAMAADPTAAESTGAESTGAESIEGFKQRIQAAPTPEGDACGEPACMAPDPEDEIWADHSHEYVESRVEGLVNWFDTFFVSEKQQVETGESFLRVRQGFRWQEGEDFDTRTRFKARAQLPNLSKRVSLAISSEDDTLLSNEDFGGLEEDILGDNDSDGSLSIQFEASRTENSRLDFRYHWRSSLDPKVSGRYRYDLLLSEKLLTRFTQEVYWASDDGLGEETRVDFDYLLSNDRLLRWRSKVHYGEETRGVEWLSQLQLVKQFSRRKALSWYLGLAGDTDPEYRGEYYSDAIVTRYFVSANWRQNIWRPWLFYEVEPALFWKKDFPGDSREMVGALTLRLEVYFGTRDL
jgi:hypothetical protein